jgi:hypothetical protein
VLRHTLVAPGDVLVELAPLLGRALDDQAGQRVHLVAGVLQRVAQHAAQRLRALCVGQAELGQQAADAVDAGRALSLQALAQAVHAQHALLLDGLHGHEAHARARGGLADRCGVVRVVLAGRALAAVGLDELRVQQARRQTQRSQAARPVVRAGADLHGHDASRGQPRAPGNKAVSRQRAPAHHAARGIDGVNLDHALGQIGADANDRAVAGFTNSIGSCNLLHGLPVSASFRLMTSNIANLGASTPSRESGKSLRIPSGAPTAGRQARTGGTRYIFASPGLASCRRRPLSSNGWASRACTLVKKHRHRQELG